MENYIVRIYRRDSDDPSSLTGVVEIPDRNENRQFSSIDELFSILNPPKNIPSPYRRKQIRENRRYRRFALNDCTLVFGSSTDVGEMIDLSMGGLSFTCPDIPEESDSAFEIGIICGEDKYFAENIPCRKLMNPGASDKSRFDKGEKDKKCRIEFGDLTPNQRLQVEHIIQSYAHSEA